MFADAWWKEYLLWLLNPSFPVKKSFYPFSPRTLFLNLRNAVLCSCVYYCLFPRFESFCVTGTYQFDYIKK